MDFEVITIGLGIGPTRSLIAYAKGRLIRFIFKGFVGHLRLIEMINFITNFKIVIYILNLNEERIL